MMVFLRTRSVAEARHLLPRELEKFKKLLSASGGLRSPIEATKTGREPSTIEVEEGMREWFAERHSCRPDSVWPSDHHVRVAIGFYISAAHAAGFNYNPTAKSGVVCRLLRSLEPS
jgi:hypothetical protein